MTLGSLDQIVEITNDPYLSEVGGGHNQKGIEFQKHWALLRMFQLAENNVPDFLFLFEAIQDVAILNSCTNPSEMLVHQVKKKDRAEWTWNNLTLLSAPSAKSQQLGKIKSSPIGKLYSTINAFTHLNCFGYFVSNAGCDVELEKGGSAASNKSTALSDLTSAHCKLLTDALPALHKSSGVKPDLTKLYFEKTSLSVEEPGIYLVGIANDFLTSRSPRHAKQARSLVEALLAQLALLGTRTSKCNSFDEIVKQHGYTKATFFDSLGKLEFLPDSLDQLNSVLNKLLSEGMPFLDKINIEIAAARIIQQRVMGTVTDEEKLLIATCNFWLASHPVSEPLLLFFETGCAMISVAYPNYTKHQLFAHLALRVFA